MPPNVSYCACSNVLWVHLRCLFIVDNNLSYTRKQSQLHSVRSFPHSIVSDDISQSCQSNWNSLLLKHNEWSIQSMSKTKLLTSVRMVRLPCSGQVLTYISNSDATLSPDKPNDSSASSAASNPWTPPNTINKCLHSPLDTLITSVQSLRTHRNGFKSKSSSRTSYSPLSDVPTVKSYPFCQQNMSAHYICVRGKISGTGNGQPAKTSPRPEASRTVYPQYRPSSSRGFDGGTALPQ